MVQLHLLLRPLDLSIKIFFTSCISAISQACLSIVGNHWPMLTILSPLNNGIRKRAFLKKL